MLVQEVARPLPPPSVPPHPQPSLLWLLSLGMVDASGHFALVLPALCQTHAVPKEREVQDPGHTAYR